MGSAHHDLTGPMTSHPLPPTTPTLERLAFCINCAYPLNQLAPATRNCPECGRAFDPNDPWSMNMERPIPQSMRWALRPARWLYPAVRIVVILALLTSVLLAGAIGYAWVALGCIWLPVGLAYFVRRSLRRYVIVRYRQDPDLLRTDHAQLRASRCLMLIAIVLLFFRVPFYAFFLPSLHWLNQRGHFEYAVRPYDAPRAHPILVGLLPVREIHVDFGGATFDTWLGGLHYYESDDGKRTWTRRSTPEYDPFEYLPW
jgi:hypothetical protein